MRKTYRYTLVILLVTAIVNKVTAQQKYSNNEIDKQYKQAYFGFGVGLDYGGFGIKAEFLPVKWVGVFGGVGYNT